MAPAARAPLPATMLPHHNGEVAMPRRWKTLIFLTALLATTLSFASLLRPSRATFIAPEGRRAIAISQRSLAPSRGAGGLGESLSPHTHTHLLS
jgi:hypothetical protein